MTPLERDSSSSRRTFLRRTSLAGATAGLALPAVLRGAPDSRKLKIGLVGCGGRGTGAANQALNADSNIVLHALGDVFPEALEKSLGVLTKQHADRVQVPESRQFTGLDAYQKVVDSCDLVLLATPPHFRPAHLRACVEAGKHVFAEKPVAVDPVGIRSVLATTELARKKNVAIVSGLCWRYETNMIETIRQLQGGLIGQIVAVDSVRYGRGVAKMAERQPGWTDLEAQLRNWYYHTWLSGDFIVEQFVHELDKVSWLLGEYPVACLASGGRIARTGPEYGNVYDHFNAVFEYASGIRYNAGTRHEPGTDGMFQDLATGSKGRCDMMQYAIYDLNGKPVQKLGKRRTDMHQLEHDAMYAALRRGEIPNNGEYMAKSSLMGIMARMSAYTGKRVTWEQAMNSQLDLSPPSYDWDQKLPEAEVAIPGVTPLI